MKLRILAMASLAALSPVAGEAKAKPVQSPLIEALTKCRAQTDADLRLDCYDAAVGVLVDASAQGNIVVVDQEEAKRTRRSLFGFNLPKLPFFSGDKSAEEDQDQISAKVTSVRALPYGRWQMKIEDGALWETTETSSVVDDPRPGQTVVIKRGPLGSYMIRIDGQRALRAKRVG